MIKKIIFSLLISANICFANTQKSIVPSSWYQHPEDLKIDKNSKFSTKNIFEDIGDAILSGILENIFSVSASMLDQIPTETPAQLAGPKPVNDYTPWHLEFATTELSVTAKGDIGVLTAKGTPSIQAYWRKQNKIAKKKTEAPVVEEQSINTGVIAMDINPEQDEKAILQSIEPMAKAALATGKIKNEILFRSELQKTAKEFYYLTNNLYVNSGPNWWLSGFRFDLLVDASGKVIANPLISVGVKFVFGLTLEELKVKNLQTKLNYRPIPQKFFLII